MFGGILFIATCLAAVTPVTAFHLPSFRKLEHQRDQDLAFMHIPFNFGHTIESVGMIEDTDLRPLKYALYVGSFGGAGDTLTGQATWDEVHDLTKPGGEVWGKSNPDLQTRNNITGCTTFFSPPKYWSEELAKSYFGDKTVFGMLRDPYERLVAIFRGQFDDYGGDFAELAAKCDVNGAVKKMMQDTIAGNVFRDGCVFVPQAEYFDGPHGITLPVDNRLFPESMNKVFADHGYTNTKIQDHDMFHVTHCPEVWAGDLDCETRKMVRDYYKRDFELLCERFGYCDDNDNTCIKGVPEMCPGKVLVAPNMSALASAC